MTHSPRADYPCCQRKPVVFPPIKTLHSLLSPCISYAFLLRSNLSSFFSARQHVYIACPISKKQDDDRQSSGAAKCSRWIQASLSELRRDEAEISTADRSHGRHVQHRPVRIRCVRRSKNARVQRRYGPRANHPTSELVRPLCCTTPYERVL